jgi:diadenosine tetraphosphate (Ap4A) HIT family hydrolase
MNHGPRCERDPDRRPGWLTAAPQELTLAGQAGPDPFLAAVTAALREIIHCSNTYAALFAEAEDLEHIHFHVLPRTDHPDTSFRGPFAFAPLGGDTAQVPGQARDQITSKLAAAASQRALPARPGDQEGQPLAPPKARRAPACTATSGMESKAVRHPRKPSIPQISRFCCAH